MYIQIKFIYMKISIISQNTEKCLECDCIWHTYLKTHVIAYSKFDGVNDILYQIGEINTPLPLAPPNLESEYADLFTTD